LIAVASRIERSNVLDTFHSLLTDYHGVELRFSDDDGAFGEEGLHCWRGFRGGWIEISPGFVAKRGLCTSNVEHIFYHNAHAVERLFDGLPEVASRGNDGGDWTSVLH
jgi:hypothetical protein